MSPDDDDQGLDISFADTASQEPVVEEEQPYSSQFFNGQEFLTKVPEPDRPIVQKYLAPVMQGWDGGLTEKFQTFKQKQKQWEELGDLEQVRAAHAFYNRFRTDGENMFGTMLKGFVEHYGPEAPRKIQELIGIEAAMSDSNMGDPSGWDYSQGEPDQSEVFQQNVMQELNELRTWREEQEAARQEEAAMSQLDSVVDTLHTANPHIPETYILQAIAAGIPPQNVVSTFEELKQSIGSSKPARTPPPFMGAGQGGVPSNQVDVSKLNRSGRESVIEQLLRAAQEG